jgi:hypothetical protein
MGGFSVGVSSGDDVTERLPTWDPKHRAVVQTVFDQCDTLTLACNPEDSGMWKVIRNISIPGDLHEILKTTHGRNYRSRHAIPRGNGSIGGCRGSGGFACETEILCKLEEDVAFRTRVCEELGIPNEEGTRFEANQHSRRVSRSIRRNSMGDIFLDNNTGDTIADIFAIHGETRYPISIKSTNLTTYVNAGVTQSLRESEIRGGAIRNTIGNLILFFLGIDATGFCHIFNHYQHEHTPESRVNLKQQNQAYNRTSTDPDTLHSWSKIVNMCMGEGDYGVIHKIHGIYHVHMKQPCGTVRRVEWQYGGSNGISKRINIIIWTDTMQYTVNIRNKQGGVYPSHMMCDFKSC